ncbi:Max dimerization protein 3 [Cichlidogyrus casuarinus]|uniref:Max dimerization protein 3 n=1 Tax=Cichlidogyrus casuarinus TaxID=1844966 RepID=A0ABD2Q7P1_9PLAT
MPGLSQESDGLLALLYAAERLDDNDKKSKPNWEGGRPYSRNHHMSESKMIKERKSLGSRCSHNELEKRRRGYLKHCMEELKERLDFKNETSRITTLSVLKRAKNEILNSQEEIVKFEELIKKEKLRSSMLSKRKFQCKKRIEDRNNSRRPLTWRERNRNYSECSVNTTSSEESELDYYARQSMLSRQGNHQQHQLSYGVVTPQRSLTPQQTRTMLPPRKHLTSIDEEQKDAGVIGSRQVAGKGHLGSLRPMVSINTNLSGQCSSLSSAGTSPSPMKAPNSSDLFMDGSSSDSGYEEISSLTPPGTSECLSPMDLTPAKPSSLFMGGSSSIAKANQLIHQQAASAVLQGTVIHNGVSYWNSVSGTVF